MGTILAVQPTPFVHVHLLARALLADHVVLLSSAQHAKRSPLADGTKVPTHQTSYRILGAAGPVETTIPVRRGRASIDKTLVVDDGWHLRHHRSIEMALSKSAHYDEVASTCYLIIDKAPGRPLAGIGEDSWAWALRALGGGPTLHTDGSLAATGSGSAWMLAIAQELGATRYLAGRSAAANYLDIDAFAAAGIEVATPSLDLQPWPQRAPGFDPDVSFLDLVANVGWERAREILTAGPTS